MGSGRGRSVGGGGSSRRLAPLSWRQKTTDSGDPFARLTTSRSKRGRGCSGRRRQRHRADSPARAPACGRSRDDLAQVPVQARHHHHHPHARQEVDAVARLPVDRRNAHRVGTVGARDTRRASPLPRRTTRRRSADPQEPPPREPAWGPYKPGVVVYVGGTWYKVGPTGRVSHDGALPQQPPPPPPDQIAAQINAARRVHARRHRTPRRLFGHPENRHLPRACCRRRSGPRSAPSGKGLGVAKSSRVGGLGDRERGPGIRRLRRRQRGRRGGRRRLHAERHGGRHQDRHPGGAHRRQRHPRVRQRSFSRGTAVPRSRCNSSRTLSGER